MEICRELAKFEIILLCVILTASDTPSKYSENFKGALISFHEKRTHRAKYGQIT